MADVADLAVAESDIYLAVEINNARRLAEHSPHTAGHCRWCGDPTPQGHSYCDADCRDDHEKHARFHR